MKSFKEYLNEKLNESKSIKVYHGSNVKFNKIEPKYMMTKESNSQEGVFLNLIKIQKI